MTDCPAYLGVQVTRRSLRFSVELLHYDLLVLCPAEFNLSLSIADPRRQQQQQQLRAVTSSMTSYDVTLTDAQQRQFHSFHTHVRFFTYRQFSLICNYYYMYLVIQAAPENVNAQTAKNETI